MPKAAYPPIPDDWGLPGWNRDRFERFNNLRRQLHQTMQRWDQLMAKPQKKASSEEWDSFWLMGRIREIASPIFAVQLDLARAQGLLVPLLAGDQVAVQKRASEILDALAESAGVS